MSKTTANTAGPAPSGLEIAIIGMAGRFPGADDIDSLWDNLVAGREAIVQLDPDLLRANGISDETLADPDYVAVGGVVADADCFDAGFFGYSPREAEILDPQQRVLLECAWHAMESAGYDPARTDLPVGVFAGAGMNGYLLNLYANPEIRGQVSPYELFVSNDKDFLATRVSYKLDLSGPSLGVQTACSTSLVAVHLACQSLIAGECDMAMAGGVGVSRQLGYRAVQGGIHSPDGHCRPFDAAAAGTVAGNGVGIVVLKRLDDALADNDHIIAVIRGSAVNNDGALKVSYTAPQVDGQAAVIRDALAMAEVSADSISYIEAHGTGTPLGDPIEVAALTRAFRNDTQRNGFCALGSVKGNIGHLDAAAGVAGLIKTALALKHRRLPASLHFESPNPQIDFDNSPFYVNGRTRDWTADAHPRRAGVSSFGIGGTNAHVVLEEAPATPPTPASQQTQVLPLSAKDPRALQDMAGRLADHLAARPTASLDDVAFVLQQGRRALPWRLAISVDDLDQAVSGLRRPALPDRPATSQPTVVFLFPGQASQYPRMAAALYQCEPVFRAALDHCAESLAAKADLALVDLLFTPGDGAALTDTAVAQPLLFAVEYALATLWQDRGAQPAAMIGHSLGELVAACVAGVMSLDSALELVALRGRLMQAMAPGAMLAVPLCADHLAAHLDDTSHVAAENGPGLCAVSGTSASIEALATRLDAAGVATTRLHSSHGFHSPAMDPVVAPFSEAVARHALSAPQTPFISCVSGTWISPDEATDPAYWGRQLRATVRFDDGMRKLLSLPDPVLIELGPGNTLCTLAGLQSDAGKAADIPRIQTLPSASQTAAHDSARSTLDALGRAWCAGVTVDLGAPAPAADPRQQPRRVPLPGYPFARERYYIDAPTAARAGSETVTQIGQPKAIADWFHVPSWQRRPVVARPPTPTDRIRWLLFADDRGIADALAEQIEHAGQDAFRVTPGARFAQSGYRQFKVGPGDAGSLLALFADLANRDVQAEQIVWLWPLGRDAEDEDREPFLELLTLVQNLGEREEPLQITVVSANACDVVGDTAPREAQAALSGLCQVVGQEYPRIGCRQIDIDPLRLPARATAAHLWHELRADRPAARCAWRGSTRWSLDFAAMPLTASDTPSVIPSHDLRRRGSYAIVGDIAGGLGQVWADALREHHQARLALIDTTGSTDHADDDLSELLHLSADPGDAAGMQAAIAAALERLDRLDGVFYSSPTTSPSSAAPLALVRPTHWRNNRQGKVDGLKALASVLASTPAAQAPAFVCVQSSLSTIVGGLGLAPYAAANHQLDALVAQQNLAGRAKWYAINWDACRDEHASPKDAAGDLAPAGVGAALAEYALTPGEVWQATERVLTLAPPGQVVVSRADLSLRLRQWVSATPRSLDETGVGARPKGKHGRHERPLLETPYLAPRDDVEQTIANIWQEALGIDRVGVDDNFFELGGHSLLAIQVIGRLRAAFPVEIEMQQLLAGNPTVATVAAALSQRLPRGDELAAMAELLQEIQGDGGRAPDRQRPMEGAHEQRL
jgi:acyl transferase domain-containing protein/acyl carrier protein